MNTNLKCQTKKINLSLSMRLNAALALRLGRSLVMVLILVVTAIFMNGCKDKVNLPDQPLSDYMQLYLPQAVNGPVTYNFSTGDTAAPTIIYGAYYGGFGYPDKDLPVSFSVDAGVADSFNVANNTDYALLPAKSYSLSNSEAVIKKGELSTLPFKITVHTTGELAPVDISRTYILPVSLSSTALPVNASLQTYFCLINIVPEFFDRSGWKIVDFSSQEAAGEGPDNGRAEFALDGNRNTYWHTAWKDARPGPPHYITIDMGQSRRILGSALVDRQNVNSGRPDEVEILVSDNGKDWQPAYAGTLLDTGDQQKVFFEKPVEGRFVKFLVKTIYGSDITNLAELYLF